jgi:hypothetical protein
MKSELFFEPSVQPKSGPSAANAKRPEAVRYNLDADRRSCRSMQQLFAEFFA